MRSNLLGFLVLAAALIGGGCDGGDGGTDAGGADTGTADTGTADTGTADTGTADTGTADSGPGPSGEFCLEECSAAADCMIGGMDIGYTCDSGRCAGTSTGCSVDDDCLVLFSGWVTACTAGGTECDALSQVCTSLGLCAYPVGGVVTCDTLMMSEHDTTDIDGGAISVCANTNYECRAGVCMDPCESDADCSVSPFAPVCDTATGRCQCGEDAHCTGAPGASVCVSGSCRCAGDTDCGDVDRADVCHDGACGCSDVTVCTGDTVFDGTTFVCRAS